MPCTKNFLPIFDTAEGTSHLYEFVDCKHDTLLRYCDIDVTPLFDVISQEVYTFLKK